jgi:hypothetical protein
VKATVVLVEALPPWIMTVHAAFVSGGWRLFLFIGVRPVFPASRPALPGAWPLFPVERATARAIAAGEGLWELSVLPAKPPLNLTETSLPLAEPPLPITKPPLPLLEQTLTDYLLVYNHFIPQ